MSALGQKRTSERFQSMSALPPKADIGTQSRNVRFVPKADIMRRSKSPLLDHLVSGDEESLRHRDAECLGCFEIDSQQIFHRHLHRKIRWLCASQDIVHIAGRTAKIVSEVCSIGNKTAVSGVDRVLKERRQMVVRRQRYDRRAVVCEETVWSTKEGTPGFTAQRVDDCFNL